MKWIVTAVLTVIGSSLAADVPAVTPGQIDQAVAALAGYTRAGDRSPVTAVEQLARDSASRPELRSRLEERLLGLLTGQATDEARFHACRQLWIIGSPRVAAVLEKMLVDEKTSHMACYAIGNNPAPEAGAVLRQALGSARGRALINVVAQLGLRRDEQAAQALAALLADETAGQAAADGLARIGTKEAAAALAQAGAAAGARTGLKRAYLECAGTLARRGEKTAALEICRTVLQDATQPAWMRRAAVASLADAGGADALPDLFAALRGQDRSIHAAAIAALGAIPGQTLTAQLAAELPRLNQNLQALLIETLAQRGGAEARQAILAAIGSDAQEVRLAALKALGRAGDAACVPALVRAASLDSQAEQAAALASLRLLKAGPENDQAIAAALAGPGPAMRVQLIRVLADRAASSAVPALLAQAGDADAAVSEAALAALVNLARAEDAPQLVALLLACKDDASRAAALRAVSASAGKIADPSRRADAILAACAQAGPAQKALLVRALGGAGNFAAFAAVRSALADPAPAVRDAAVRTLEAWPDGSAVPLLLDIARTSDDAVHRTLALRGTFRLAAMVASTADRPSPQVVQWYVQAAAAARTADDQKLLLAGLSALAHPKALELALPLVDAPAVRDEAIQAVIQITTALAGSGQASAGRAALTRIAASTGDAALRERINEALARTGSSAGYVTVWQAAGPYVQAGKQCQELYHVAFDPEGPSADQAAWRLIAGGHTNPNLVNLGQIDGGTHRVAYLRTFIVSGAEQSAQIEAGFDDGGKVWLNGAVVLEANTAGACVPGQHKAQVKLRKGPNRLLVKATQHSGPFEMCLRVVGSEAAAPLEFAVTPGAAAPALPEPPAAPASPVDQAPAVSLFDGKTLTGWEGDQGIFRVEDGAIVGGQLKQPIPRSAYLCTTAEYGDFDLTVEVRLLGGTNGGVEFWGSRIPNHHEMKGWQADLAAGALWGCLYDAHRNGIRVLIEPKELAKIVRPNDWNEYRIRAVGDHIELWLNGYRTVHYVEADAKIPRRGVFGLQTHQGPPGEVWYRNFRLKTVPAAGGK